MLKTLHIHNYAIIDEIAIAFSPKMNVITGETGAGKSILMGALSLILGDRADTSVLQNREKKCVVEGTFRVEHAAVKKILQEHELDDSGSEEMVIRREIAVNGKSRAFVNDTPVNLDLLKQVSALLVDLHRQFDTLSVADAAFQRDVLDALANNAALLQQYQDTYRQWRQEQDELDALRLQKAAFNKEYDYHKFLSDELEEADLKENELEEADAELKMLGNAEAIKNALGNAADHLSGGDQPFVQQLKSIHHQLDPFARYHNGLEELLKRLHSTQIELQDIANEIESINDHIAHDPQRIGLLNERISTGYKLQKKHGVSSTADLIAIRENLSEKLRAVLDIDERMQQKEKSVAVLYLEMGQLSARLTDKRLSQVKPLQDKVNKLLVQVGMPNARIKVTIGDKTPDAYGKDDVEFLFNANTTSSKAGDKDRFESLRKVASGGELSRLMLSIKSLVAESMDMPTLIFDEIDTGISGEAAKQVGMIMNGLSSSRQLITITHQPQIAGRADAHLFVYKDIRNDVIRTNIRLLSGEERITAIAKMLSGEKPTAAALENAREMIMN